MPELPEVEVVRRGLERFVAGATVTAVEVLDERALKRHRGDALDFVDRLEGSQFLEPRRRGKFLWVPLGASGGIGQDALMTHLGMSGQLLVQPVGAPDERQLCIRLRLATEAGDEYELRFADQRRFGSLAIDALDASGTPSQVAHIALDPLDPAFDAAATVAKLRRGQRAIKAVLLDQSVVSGVGNIYADEALWATRLHWAQPAYTVSARKAHELLREVRAVFERALAEGGTSFDSLYVNVNGESGYLDIDVERVEGSRAHEGRDCLCRASAMRRQAILRSDLARRALDKQLNGPAHLVAHRHKVGSRSLRGVACA